MQNLDIFLKNSTSVSAQVNHFNVYTNDAEQREKQYNCGKLKGTLI